MRIRVSHDTTYRYDRPVKSIVQVLRMTPCSHDGQHVAAWRLEIDVDGEVRVRDDAFGNIVHMVSIEGPSEEVTVSVSGEVETLDTQGVVQGLAERFSPAVYLRETPLTAPDPGLRAFAERFGNASDRLSLLHRLLTGIHAEVAFDTEPTHAGTTACEAFAMRRGVCQDFAHIFIAAARHLGTPARYVSGYFARADGIIAQEAGHAWAEALVPDLGWVGFDPANGIAATEAHVRVAAALDYLGAAPVRGSRQGGGTERLDVALTVAASMRQGQS